MPGTASGRGKAYTRGEYILYLDLVIIQSAMQFSRARTYLF